MNTADRVSELGGKIANQIVTPVTHGAHRIRPGRVSVSPSSTGRKLRPAKERGRMDAIVVNAPLPAIRETTTLFAGKEPENGFDGRTVSGR